MQTDDPGSNTEHDGISVTLVSTTWRAAIVEIREGDDVRWVSVPRRDLDAFMAGVASGLLRSVLRDVLSVDGTYRPVDIETEFGVFETRPDDAMLLAPERSVETGRYSSTGRSKDHRDEGQPRRPRLSRPKKLALIGAGVVAVVVLGVVISQAGGGSETAQAPVATAVADTTSTAPTTSTTVVEVPIIETSSSEPVLLSFDEAFGDPWVLVNVARDQALGFGSAGEMYASLGPAYASVAGEFNLTRTVLTEECLEQSPCSELSRLGDVAPRTYVFAIDCTAGVPCVGQALTQYSIGDVVQQQLVPMTFDGATYRWSLSYEGPQCFFDNDNNGSFETLLGNIATNFDWVLTPLAAEIRDGRWVATSVNIDIVVDNRVTSLDPACDQFLVYSNRETGVATGSR